jgi:hypothetical protein
VPFKFSFCMPEPTLAFPMTFSNSIIFSNMVRLHSYILSLSLSLNLSINKKKNWVYYSSSSIVLFTKTMLYFFILLILDLLSIRFYNLFLFTFINYSGLMTRSIHRFGELTQYFFGFFFNLFCFQYHPSTLDCIRNWVSSRGERGGRLGRDRVLGIDLGLGLGLIVFLFSFFKIAPLHVCCRD